MKIKDIAARYVELYQKGEIETIYKELYSPDCEAFEPAHAPMQHVKGLDQIKEKGRQFQAGFKEMHSGFCSEPVAGADYFSVAMGMDVTMKDGKRINMSEIAVFKVNEGRIVEERFFF